MEAESYRIGKVAVPKELWDKPKQVIDIMINRSISYRVDCIYDEYIKDLSEEPWFKSETSINLDKLIKRIGTPQITTSIK